jgi:hypothetical protein
MADRSNALTMKVNLKPGCATLVCQLLRLTRMSVSPRRSTTISATSADCPDLGLRIGHSDASDPLAPITRSMASPKE